jgi:hypothetical protein
VIEIERKMKTLMISAVVVLAVLSGIAFMTYANGVANDTSTTTTDVPGYFIDQYYNNTRPCCGRREFGGGGGRGMPITISEEYKDNVLNITEGDTDVQALLTEGYNITGVRPIIGTTVEADGTVTMKATNALVSLQKDTTGRALVWVDVEQAKVTRIEILTITVIEKA